MWLIVTYGTFNQFSNGIVEPPWMMTVAITINDVVVNIACLASDRVFRIARAKETAPLSPTFLRDNNYSLLSDRSTCRTYEYSILITYQQKIAYAGN